MQDGGHRGVIYQHRPFICAAQFINDPMACRDPSSYVTYASEQEFINAALVAPEVSIPQPTPVGIIDVGDFQRAPSKIQALPGYPIGDGVFVRKDYKAHAMLMQYTGELSQELLKTEGWQVHIVTDKDGDWFIGSDRPLCMAHYINSTGTPNCVFVVVKYNHEGSEVDEYCVSIMALNPLARGQELQLGYMQEFEDVPVHHRMFNVTCLGAPPRDSKPFMFAEYGPKKKRRVINCQWVATPEPNAEIWGFSYGYYETSDWDYINKKQRNMDFSHFLVSHSTSTYTARDKKLKDPPLISLPSPTRPHPDDLTWDKQAAMYMWGRLKPNVKCLYLHGYSAYTPCSECKPVKERKITIKRKSLGIHSDSSEQKGGTRQRSSSPIPVSVPETVKRLVLCEHGALNCEQCGVVVVERPASPPASPLF